MDDQANSQSSIFSLEHAFSAIRHWPMGVLVLVAVPVLSLFGAIEVFVAGIIYRAGGAAALNGNAAVSLTAATALAMASAGWVAVATVCGPVTWLLGGFFLRPNLVWRLAGFSLLGATFTVVHLAGMSLGFLLVNSDNYWLDQFRVVYAANLRNFWTFEVFTFVAFMAVYQIVQISRVAHERQVFSAQLEAQLAETRLDALRSQLNPHFLFNSLNAISGLALRGDTEAVTEALGRLSDLLRRVLDRTEGEVALGEEMQFIDDYLELHRLRFSDRLTVEKQVADDTLEALVPTMLLQPIVENALKHGVGSSPGPHRVTVSAARENGSLVLEVGDSGGGFTEHEAQDGIGLSNTRERLKQLYGPTHRLEIGTARGGGASVRVTIPFVISHAVSA